jgi:hypothetical protein
LCNGGQYICAGEWDEEKTQNSSDVSEDGGKNFRLAGILNQEVMDNASCQTYFHGDPGVHGQVKQYFHSFNSARQSLWRIDGKILTSEVGVKPFPSEKKSEVIFVVPKKNTRNLSFEVRYSLATA